jgi:hypothetical protein
MPRTRTAVAISIAATVLTGCSSLNDLFDRRQNATNQQVTVAESTTSLYLRNLESLVSPDAETRSTAYRDIEEDFRSAPTTTNRLRFAMALATPDQDFSDELRAQQMLTEILAQPDLLLDDERALARMQLAALGARLNAKRAAQLAKTSASRSTGQELATLRAQLAAAERRNAELTAALDEAEEKLRAITQIERSIRERNEDGTNSAQNGGGAPGND